MTDGLKNQLKKTNLSAKQIKEIIVQIISRDPRPIPLDVLKSKFSRYLKIKHPGEKVSEEKFLSSLLELKESYLIGENQFGKWFIDYPDYPPNGNFGVGFLDINSISGNGFITIKKSLNEYKKSSHFVHKKNLNGAKTGDYVSFVELDIKFKKKRTNKYALIDASVTEVLEAPSE